LKQNKLTILVENPYFESAFCLLILLNSAVIAVELQYKGHDIGHELEVRGYQYNADEAWPGATETFNFFDAFFGLIFTLELVLKFIGLRSQFLRRKWNCFDVLVVGIWWGTRLGQMTKTNPMILRLIRMARLLRLLRVLNSLEAMDSLRLFVASLRACLPILVWSSFVLFGFQMFCGMCLITILTGDMTDTDNLLEDRLILFDYFGSFSKSMVTMFELSLGNWVPVCRFLMQAFGEWYASIFIIYKLVVGFGVLKILGSIFLHETFKTAASDDSIMILHKRRLQQKHAIKMKRFLLKADMSKDGELSRAEFKAMFRNEDVRTWFAAQGLETQDADFIFDLLDNEDNTLTLAELTNGIAKLSGFARSIDVLTLLHMTSKLLHLMNSGARHPLHPSEQVQLPRKEESKICVSFNPAPSSVISPDLSLAL